MTSSAFFQESKDTYSRNPCFDPVVVVFDNTPEAEMVYGIVENRVLEWRPRAAACQNGGGKNKKKRVFDVYGQLFSGSSSTAC